MSVCEVLQFGERKYGARNWELGINYSRLYGALIRHAVLFFCFREDRDKESGLPHTAHLACNALMLLSTYLRDSAGKFDDRPAQSLEVNNEP